jgi:virulence-associated protein VapD
MQQIVTIFVICGESGRQLFDDSQSTLTDAGFDWDRDLMIKNGQLAYWASLLDVWSMGDTFERFIKPAKNVRTVRVESRELVCCRREKIRIAGKPRNEEERRLKEILIQAKEAYEDATSESYLFQIRSVLHTSDGFNPEAQQIMDVNLPTAPQPHTRSPQ